MRDYAALMTALAAASGMSVASAYNKLEGVDISKLRELIKGRSA